MNELIKKAAQEFAASFSPRQQTHAYTEAGFMAGVSYAEKNKLTPKENEIRELVDSANALVSFLVNYRQYSQSELNEYLSELQQKTNQVQYRLIDDSEEIKNNVYIRLYHGRDTKEEQMEDWGFECPYIIQCSGFIWTYGTFRVFWGKDWETDLKVNEDMIEFMGKFYGDFELFTNIEEWEEHYRNKVIPVQEFERLQKEYEQSLLTQK